MYDIYSLVIFFLDITVSFLNIHPINLSLLEHFCNYCRSNSQQRQEEFCRGPRSRPLGYLCDLDVTDHAQNDYLLTSIFHICVIFASQITHCFVRVLIPRDKSLEQRVECLQGSAMVLFVVSQRMHVG